jgi:hypothetical protein
MEDEMREWISREAAERWHEGLMDDARAVMMDRIPEVAAEIVAVSDRDERLRILERWMRERQERLERLVGDYLERLGDDDPPKVQ